MADFKKFLNNFNPDPEKAGKLLLVINTLGMISAAVTNTFAAAVDKNTSAEDKKFLVPAGVATGFANIGIYYLMTDKIIKKLKISVKGVIDNMQEKGTLDDKAKILAQKTINKAEKGFMGTGLFKKPELVESMKTNLFDKAGNITDNARNLYRDSVTASAGVAGAFFGAVVGCAILTPIIRDVSAYFVQKRMEKKNPEMADKPYKPYFEPTRLESYRYGEVKRQPLSMKSYMAFTDGASMKI